MPRWTRSKGLYSTVQQTVQITKEKAPTDDNPDEYIITNLDVPVAETIKNNRKRPIRQKTRSQESPKNNDEVGKCNKKKEVSETFSWITEEILIPKTENKTDIERTASNDCDDQLFPYPILTEAQIKKEIIETDSESSSSSDSSSDENDDSSDESASSSGSSDSESGTESTPSSQENVSQRKVSIKNNPRLTSLADDFKKETPQIIEPLTVLPYKGKKRGPKRKKPIKVRDPNKPIRKSPGQPWVPIPCPHCDKTFRYISLLRQHSTAHSKERPFLCSECGHGFKRNCLLEEHRAIYHLGIESKPKLTSCSFCHKSCSNSYELKLHLRTHTGEKPFTCHICERSFSVARTLKIHLRRHAGEKPYKCTVADCDKAFAVKLELQRHVGRSHSNEDGKGVRKPVQCEECGRSFSHIGILKDHLLIHKGIKPFQCPFCDISFRQANHLDSHIRVHKWKENEDLDD